MKISTLCYDIEDLLEKLTEETDPTECIFTASEIIKICKNIIDVAIEEASCVEVKKKQTEFNL